MNTQEFFANLFGYADGSSYIWTLPDKSTYQAANFQAMTDIAIRENFLKKNVYFSVGVTEKRLSPHERAKSSDIIGIPALWADIDIAGAGHAANNLPPDYAAARGLLPAQFEPSIIVFSGHGIHVYYVFRELLDTRTEEEQRFAVDLLKRLQGVIRVNAAAHGWHVDSTTDLARVLRVPGTINRKNGSETRCEVAESGDNRYNPDDFDDALPPLEEVAAPTTNKPTRGKFERRTTDGDARLMLANCTFLQYWQQNYKTLPEPFWKAACTNIMRGVGGEEIILPLAKEWLGQKYDESKTRQKFSHYLNECQPQTCKYIQTELHFGGCVDCPGLKAPNGWSLGKIPQAIARIRSLMQPTVGIVFAEKTLQDLAVVKNNAIGEYAIFKEKAKAAGINLRDLEKAVKNAAPTAALTVGARLGDITTQGVFDNAPVNLAIPPNFSFDSRGVYESKPNNSGGFTEHLACGQPLVISCKLYNLDTQTEKITLQFLYYGYWRPIKAKRSEVFSARSIVNLADTGLNISSESAKYAVHYLQALEANNPGIPMIYAVSKIGWRDGLKDFVLPSVPGKYILDMDEAEDAMRAFNRRGELGEWLNFAAKIRAYPYARFMLAASFAAPLLKILHARNFMVYFWGTSGGAKTAAMYFAISVWGEPEKMVRSFYGTTNGLERAAEYSNDFPLAINERQVTIGNNKQDALESLVYILEGGRGKIRASKTGLRTMATWRTISLGTGEEPISQESSIQGIKTRMLELNTYPVLPNELGKEVYPFTAGNHGTAGAAYIKRLLQEADRDYGEITKTMHNMVNHIRANFPYCLDPHIDAVAVVCTADLLVDQWLFGGTDSRSSYDLALSIAKELPQAQEITDTVRAAEFIREWLLSNRQRFAAHADDLTPIVPEYGFLQAGFYNVYPSYLTEALNKGGFKAVKILKELADKGRISYQEENGKRRYKIRVRRAGERVYVVQIPVGVQE